MLTPSSSSSSYQQLQPWLMWGCAVLFFFFQLILRVSPNVMAQDLMVDFAINASDIGAIGAASYLAYSLAQFPVGIMLDHWGARRSITIAVTLCVIGCMMFAGAKTVLMAKIARGFIGVGSAGGFLGCVKVATMWFPLARVGLVLGLTVTIGTLGGIYGGKPLAIIIQAIGWRQTTIYMALIGAILTLTIAVFIRNEPFSSKPRMETSNFSIYQSLCCVLRTPECWTMALAGVGVYLVLSVFADMWSVTYLQNVYHVSRETAAGISAYTYVGLMLGGPICAWSCDVLQSRRLPMLFFSSVALLLWLSIFTYSWIPLAGLKIALACLGATAGAQIIGFAVVADIIPKAYNAVASAFINMTVMLLGGVMQYSVGKLLNFHWDGILNAEGAPVYAEGTFRLALSYMLIWLVLSIVLTLYTKETYNRVDKNHLDASV